MSKDKQLVLFDSIGSRAFSVRVSGHDNLEHDGNTLIINGKIRLEMPRDLEVSNIYDAIERGN